MNISYEKFLGALHALQESSLSGDNVTAKFKHVVEQLMPADLKEGKYKMLGMLLNSMATEFFPLTTTDYTSKDADLRRLEQGVRDILETVDYVLRKCASGEEGADLAVKETLSNLQPRIRKMNKMKTKFVYISLRPNLKASIIRASKLPAAIDDFLGTTDPPKGEMIEEEMLETIVDKNTSFLAKILRSAKDPAFTHDEHLERYCAPELFELYIRVLRTLGRRLELKGETRIDGVSPALKSFITQGVVHRKFWERSQQLHKKLTDPHKARWEDWIDIHGGNLPQKQDPSEAGFFDVLDWLEWNLSMARGLPTLITARKSMMLYNNLIIELLKKRETLLEQSEALNKDHEGLEATIKAVDKKMIANVRETSIVMAKKMCADFPDAEADWSPLLEELRTTHQVLSVLEMEMARVSKQIEAMIKKKSEESLIGIADQTETLIRRCLLGVQSNATSTSGYTTLYHRDTELTPYETITASLDKLKQIYPKFKISLQGFSFKKPLSYKVKDFSSDFTPKNIAGKIRNLRAEFNENSDGFSKLKVLWVPGCGAGSYDSQSNTLLIPAFRHKTNFEAENFFTALADCLLKTRTGLSESRYNNLFKRIQKTSKLSPYLKERHHLQVVSIAIRELLKQNEKSDHFSDLKANLEPLFHHVEEDLDESALDDALTILVDAVQL